VVGIGLAEDAAPALAAVMAYIEGGMLAGTPAPESPMLAGSSKAGKTGRPVARLL